MANPNSGASPPRTGYSQAGSAAFEELMAQRTVSESAGFLLSHLSPGMAVLDVGCGPGSITVGLGAVVSPGRVTGIDKQPLQVEAARARARQLTVTNVTFEVADAYDLPFRDASFDAVFAHAVLMHLGEPVRALREMRRVLRPGGVLGVRDPDLGGSGFLVPMTDVLQQWRAVGARVRAHNNANPFPAREHRRLLLEAGFERTEASASVVCAGSPSETAAQAEWFRDQFQGFASTALEQGWLDQAAVQTVLAALDEWGALADAFNVGVWCAALGWR